MYLMYLTSPPHPQDPPINSTLGCLMCLMHLGDQSRVFSIEIVKLLLLAGANKSAEDADGLTACEWADGQPEIQEWVRVRRRPPMALARAHNTPRAEPCIPGRGSQAHGQAKPACGAEA